MDKVDRALKEATAGAGPGGGRGHGGKTSAIIDHYLAAVRALGDATPSDDDLRISKRYLDLLTSQTAVDHLKSIDELLVQNPLEFNAAKKELAANEDFVYTCCKGKVEDVVKALDKQWNNVFALDRNGCSALHAVSGTAEGSPDVAILLISRGANPNLVDYESLCPLHWAAESNNLDVARVLLQAGANLAAKNQTGMTAAMMVEQAKPKNLDSWREMFASFERANAEAAAAAAAAAGKLTSSGSPRVPALSVGSRAKSASASK